MLMLQYVYTKHRDELNKIWLTYGNTIRLRVKNGDSAIVARSRYIAPWWSSDNSTTPYEVETTSEGEICMHLHDQGSIHELEGKPLIPEGVFVESVEGPAEEAGIKIGDRLVSVQVELGPVTAVNSIRDVVEAMKTMSGKKLVKLVVERDPNWPADEKGCRKSFSERINAVLDQQVSQPNKKPDGLSDDIRPEHMQIDAAKDPWDLETCIREIKNLHCGAISLHRFLEYDLWIATQPFIDSVLDGKSRTLFEHLMPMAIYIANGQPKICRALLQHVSDREHLIKFRPDMLTAIGQSPPHLCDSNIEHWNGLMANFCKQMNTGATGNKEADKNDYENASASSPGLVELEHEMSRLFLGATEAQRKSERVYTHERVKGDYFKAVRAIMLEFLKSLIRSACTGDLDKTWPPINPFDTGKEAALAELEAWKMNQDKSVRNMFRCMVERREAELENQKRARTDATDIFQKSSTRAAYDETAFDPNQSIHPDAIKNMGKDIVDLTFNGEAEKGEVEVIELHLKMKAMKAMKADDYNDLLEPG